MRRSGHHITRKETTNSTFEASSAEEREDGHQRTVFVYSSWFFPPPCG